MSGAAAAVAALGLAVALDLALGDPPSRVHPVAWMGRALALGRRALCRGGRARLSAGGALVTLGVAAAAALAGGGLATLAAGLGWAGIVLEAAALKSALSLRGLAAAARQVERDLARGDLEAARADVALHLVSRPTATLGEAEVASAAVESVAENLTDALVAPACFYLAFGLPGALAYRAVNTADAMLGYREGSLEHFGKAAAHLDDLLNLVPARLAALAIVAAAGPAGGDPRRAWSALRRDRRATASPNAGWTMAAMAGALGVTLVKRGAYRLGDGALPTASHIGRSLGVARWAAAIALAGAVGARVAMS